MSSMPKSHKIIIVCAVVGGVSGLVILSALALYLWQRRRESQQRARSWPGGTDSERRQKAPQSVMPIPMGSKVHESAISSVGSDLDEGPSTPRVQEQPPKIPLPSGWPRMGSPTSPSGRRAEKRREALGSRERASRLMDDTPFEHVHDIEEGSGEAVSLSTAHAESGSTAPSAAPSRSASRRNRARSAGARRSDTGQGSTRVGRHSRMASMWSWSHRATPSVADTDLDGEPLPAYTFRRSGSTTRSRHDSRAYRGQSTARLDGDVAGSHNFPRELAKKIALLYKKPSPDQDPPGYT